MPYAEDELQDIETVKTLLNMLMTIEKPAGLSYRNSSSNKMSHPGRCSDGVRRATMIDYLDFLFPPDCEAWIAQYVASASDRTIVMRKEHDHALSFTVTYN